MCGVAGFFNFADREANVADLNKMLPGILHRGPDGSRHFINRNFGMVHARLSIIDTSAQGDQPLFNEDKTLALICNGEIYNYKSIRADLEKKGHRFSSHSDSEVLVHLYEELRDEPRQLLSQLKGMFAFAIYDIKRQELFLARDRFGIKPLYYVQDSQGFYFASELSALVSIQPHIADNIDYTSLYEYFQFLSIPEPNTIYTQTKALPAGHYGFIRQNKYLQQEWYALEQVAHPTTSLGFETYSALLCEKIERCVVEHLVSDVSIGSFLSGGIDSTMVTHFAHRHADSSFTSISAGFPEDSEDESEVAKKTASAMQVRHDVFEQRSGFFDDVTEVFSRCDQPFAVSSAFSLFRISKLAHQKMKVVLTGDGGDEVFAGYGLKHSEYHIPRVVKRTPKILHPLAGAMTRLLPDVGLTRHYKMSAAQRFLSRNRSLSESCALSFIPAPKRKQVDTGRFERDLGHVLDRAEHLSWLHQLLFADIHTFLKSEMLYKVDRMTMAHGLEARVPLLDHELVELAFSAPSHYLRNGTTGKLPLRNWVNRHYPGLGSRPKTGFNAPIGRLLKTDSDTRKRAVELLVVARDSDWVESGEINLIAEKFKDGRDYEDNMILGIACLGGWLKKV